MATLRQIITLTAEQYKTLTTNGSITVDGVTYPYNENTLYIVPEGEDEAKVKTKTTADWAQNASYVPTKGEIIVYSDKDIIDGQPVPSIKVGDGVSTVISLPFISASTVTKLQHTITFGAGQAFTFDGSSDLIIPIYTGSYRE